MVVWIFNALWQIRISYNNVMVSSRHDKATHMIKVANHLLGSPSFTAMHSYKN